MKKSEAVKLKVLLTDLREASQRRDSILGEVTDFIDENAEIEAEPSALKSTHKAGEVLGDDWEYAGELRVPSGHESFEGLGGDGNSIGRFTGVSSESLNGGLREILLPRIKPVPPKYEKGQPVVLGGYICEYIHPEKIDKTSHDYVIRDRKGSYHQVMDEEIRPATFEDYVRVIDGERVVLFEMHSNSFRLVYGTATQQFCPRILSLDKVMLHALIADGFIPCPDLVHHGKIEIPDFIDENVEIEAEPSALKSAHEIAGGYVANFQSQGL